MSNNEIWERLSSIPVPSSNYLVFTSDAPDCYFGKDSEGCVVFMLLSKSPQLPPINQETKSLRFILNQKCMFNCSGKEEKNTMHILTCKEKDPEKITAFIRLTKSFSSTEVGQDQYYLAKLFSSISALFDKQRRVSEIEVQGLFAELYTILYLNNHGCDVSRYWQSKNKMKFDFSFNDSKRMEIKSTLKSQRIHHFKHEQLLDQLYDIRIVSILLRKCDGGSSLSEVVEQIRSLYADNFPLMLHIESTVSQIDNDLLNNIKYDLPYLDNGIRFYDAKEIPHFNEKTPEGVFNAEYDCALDNAKSVDLKDLIAWIEKV